MQIFFEIILFRDYVIELLTLSLTLSNPKHCNYLQLDLPNPIYDATPGEVAMTFSLSGGCILYFAHRETIHYIIFVSRASIIFRQAIFRGFETVQVWNWQFFELLAEEMTKNYDFWPQMTEEIAGKIKRLECTESIDSKL